jgi:tellurite resistance protein TehA-like permease
MSEVGVIFLSAVASSFVVTLLIVIGLGLLYTLVLKCIVAYIAFDRIAEGVRKECSPKIG